MTYGDGPYQKSKERLTKQAEATSEFDEVIAYGQNDLSVELLESDIIKVPRGSGLWSWKPDIILKAMESHDDGDMIVYCDAGCSVYPSKEWQWYWHKLEQHDIVAQRLYQQTGHWTRRELMERFSSNGPMWHKLYQHMATALILKVTPFTIAFVREWRDLMIQHPELAYDVPHSEIASQQKGFKENRHDQAVFSALIYKHLSQKENRDKIYTQWEHIEDYDLIFHQAIRATRLKSGELETTGQKLTSGIKRLIKDYIFRPFYFAPKQWIAKLEIP